jgi:hypothetical protein
MVYSSFGQSAPTKPSNAAAAHTALLQTQSLTTLRDFHDQVDDLPPGTK